MATTTTKAQTAVKRQVKTTKKNSCQENLVIVESPAKAKTIENI